MAAHTNTNINPNLRDVPEGITTLYGTTVDFYWVDGTIERPIVDTFCTVCGTNLARVDAPGADDIVVSRVDGDSGYGYELSHGACLDGYGPDWEGLDMGADDEFSEYDDETFVPIKRRSAKLTDLVGQSGERDMDNNLVTTEGLGEVAMLRATDGKAAQRKAWGEKPERKASRNRRKAGYVEQQDAWS